MNQTKEYKAATCVGAGQVQKILNDWSKEGFDLLSITPYTEEHLHHPSTSLFLVVAQRTREVDDAAEI
jgi:hypothetical protein